jgi:hypothetical protein
MLVRTVDGHWVNPARVAFVTPATYGSKACFSGIADNEIHTDYTCCSETADALAALLNGAAQPAPRMVELTRDNGRLWSICPVDVANVMESDPEHCYVTARGDANECYRVRGDYQDIKRLLFGDAAAAGKDGE